MNKDKFKDPENLEEIRDLITKCPTLKEIIELIEQIYPNWIITFLHKYSDDYPHLEKNWEILTKKTNINKTQILIVEYIDDEDDGNHELIQLFVQLFNEIGFIVRSKEEIFPCKICKAAIPHIPSYNKMKELNLEVPEVWNDKCSKC